MSPGPPKWANLVKLRDNALHKWVWNDVRLVVWRGYEKVPRLSQSGSFNLAPRLSQSGSFNLARGRSVTTAISRRQWSVMRRSSWMSPILDLFGKPRLSEPNLTIKSMKWRFGPTFNCRDLLLPSNIGWVILWDSRMKITAWKSWPAETLGCRLGEPLLHQTRSTNWRSAACW